MITASAEQELIDKIKTLTELEFSSLLTEMAQHLRVNKWEHVIDECFDIETYEDELESMRETMESFRDRAFYAEKTIKKIKEAME